MNATPPAAIRIKQQHLSFYHCLVSVSDDPSLLATRVDMMTNKEEKVEGDKG